MKKLAGRLILLLFAAAAGLGVFGLKHFARPGQENPTPSAGLQSAADQASMEAPDTDRMQEGFQVRFLDVGQGDASLVLCDGHSMLIDGGSRLRSAFLYAYLKNAGIRHLDYIVCTHPDEDHIGGLAGALNYASVDTALSPVRDDDSESFQDFCKYLARQNVSVTVPCAGDTYSLGSARIRILGPVKTAEQDNDNSIVLQVIHGSSAFLFTGDAEAQEEEDILHSGADLHSQVLKVAHHGSATSTGGAWLDAVSPSAAVICCGENNAYGHPAEAVLNRLKDRKIRVFRTDLQGEIVFEEKDGVLYFGTEKDPEAEVYIPGIIPDRGPEAGSVPEDSGQRAAEPEEKALTDDLQERDYVVNLNTGKFHLPDCASVSEMREKNRLYVHCSRTELTDRGYEPCRNCNP